MKSNKLTLCVLGFMLLFTVAAASAADAQNQTSSFDAATKSKIIKFNVPGAEGTFPLPINAKGWIAGYYIDSSNVYHGFLRSPGGTFKTFEAPGAGTDKHQGTFAYSLNTARDIAGYYIDSSGVYHGFLRSPGGTFTTFDAPNAGTHIGQGTEAVNIDPSGTTIAGYYIDSSSVVHGFVRAPKTGTITEFSATGAGTHIGQGTFTAGADGINPSGAIAGWYVDAKNMYHAFLRAPTGKITPFKVPGASGQGTYSDGINPSGAIAGSYLDASNVYHGFLRAPKTGHITTFNVKGAGTGSGQGTFAENINTGGDTTGQYIDSSYVNHGFLRLSNGHITTFNVPGAGTDRGQGTVPECNNTADAITGYYLDSSGAVHGFLWTP